MAVCIQALCFYAVQDLRLLFRLKKQKLVELLRKGGIHGDNQALGDLEHISMPAFRTWVELVKLLRLQSCVFIGMAHSAFLLPPA